jgi:glyoxylase I family protein
VTALRQRGVRIVSEPGDVPPLGLRFAFFCDPWGNLFELLEPLAATER